MSQLLSTPDVAMLQENAGVILQLMQQAGLPDIKQVGFDQQSTGRIVAMISESHPVCNYHEIIAFFKDKLKMEVDLCHIDTQKVIRSFKILSAEVSQVKITATYDVCTVQSVLAAAVKETPHPDRLTRGSTEYGDLEYVIIGTISMPDTDMIEDATAQIAYERFDEETMHSSVREIGRSSVEKRWVK